MAIAPTAGAQSQNTIPPEDFSPAKSLESLKKRSATTHWKTIKGSAKSDAWNTIPAPDSPRPKRIKQPVFQQRKPAVAAEPFFPEASSLPPRPETQKRAELPKEKQPIIEQLPVFNLTEKSTGTPEPRFETKTTKLPSLPASLPAQSEPNIPNLTDSFSAEPFEVPNLSESTSPELNAADFPDSSEFKRPILRPKTRPLPAAEINTLTQQPQGRNFALPRRTAYLPQTSARPEDNRYRPAPLQKITDISPFANYTPKGSKTGGSIAIPQTERLDKTPYTKRNFEETVFTWEPSNLSYNPLYFEDAPLERYGHTYHPALQPFVSTARFGLQLVGLPYQMAIDPIYKRRYPLGYYRPGEWAPKKLYQIPFNIEAAIVEGGALTGAFFLIP